VLEVPLETRRLMPAEPFREAINEWETKRDVERHLGAYGGMGSLNDGELATWDEDTQSYVSDSWPAACYGDLLGAILESGELIRNGGGGEDVSPQPATLDFRGQTNEQCLKCGYGFVRPSEVNSLAALVWSSLIARPRIAAGRIDEVVAAALAGPADHECAEWITRVESELASLEIALVDEGFRQPTFADPTDDWPMDEPLPILSGDDPCPRCGANEWGQQWWHVTAPPLRVEQGMDPFTYLDHLKRRNGGDF
jgi:hypothetical protein